MNAGRELDALVAEKVFGNKTRKVRYLDSYSYEEGHMLDPKYQKTNFSEALAEVMDEDEVLYGHFGCEGTGVRLNLVPHYSTEIEDAWKVVMQMAENPNPKLRTLTLRAYSYSRTYSSFNMEDWEGAANETEEGNGAHATPLAICLAALKALGVEIPA